MCMTNANISTQLTKMQIMTTILVKKHIRFMRNDFSICQSKQFVGATRMPMQKLSFWAKRCALWVSRAHTTKHQMKQLFWLHYRQIELRQIHRKAQGWWRWWFDDNFHFDQHHCRLAGRSVVVMMSYKSHDDDDKNPKTSHNDCWF